MHGENGASAPKRMFHSSHSQGPEHHAFLPDGKRQLAKAHLPLDRRRWKFPHARAPGPQSLRQVLQNPNHIVRCQVNRYPALIDLQVNRYPSSIDLKSLIQVPQAPYYVHPSGQRVYSVARFFFRRSFAMNLGARPWL